MDLKNNTTAAVGGLAIVSALFHILDAGTISKLLGKGARSASDEIAPSTVVVEDLFASKASPLPPLQDPTSQVSAGMNPKGLSDMSKYDSLRDRAANGDTLAMLEMNELNRSGAVIVSDEPWPGYWLFQAARLGNEIAKARAKSECFKEYSRRSSDKQFDSACDDVEKQR